MNYALRADRENPTHFSLLDTARSRLADPKAAKETLAKLVELGVDFVDTADAYGPFISEDLIAEVPDAKTASHVLGVLAHLLDPS